MLNTAWVEGKDDNGVGEMVISGVVPAVREVFDITGFSDIFTLV